jgi:hypothetical protein
MRLAIWICIGTCSAAWGEIGTRVYSDSSIGDSAVNCLPVLREMPTSPILPPAPNSFHFDPNQLVQGRKGYVPFYHFAKKVPQTFEFGIKWFDFPIVPYPASISLNKAPVQAKIQPLRNFLYERQVPFLWNMPEPAPGSASLVGSPGDFWER